MGQTLLEFHRSVKLGRPDRPVIDPRRLKLEKYFGALPPAPRSVQNTRGMTSFGMMLNDRLGCCTISAVGHALQIWSLGRGGIWTPPDSVILQKYESWCGYVNGDPSTDNGDTEVDVLNKWRKFSFWGHALKMYADPSLTNLELLKLAIDLLGGVYIGVALPISAQGQRVWDVVPGQNGVPGSWGGHAVFVPNYQTMTEGDILFDCISWSELYQITEAFWLYNDPTNGQYVDEAHGLVAPEYLNLKTGETPAGLNLEQMEADALAIAA